MHRAQFRDAMLLPLDLETRLQCYLGTLHFFKSIGWGGEGEGGGIWRIVRKKLHDPCVTCVFLFTRPLPQTCFWGMIPPPPLPNII